MTRKKEKMGVDTLLVKELRQKTGAGVYACKHALEKAGGDLEKAVKFLIVSGVQVAEKKKSKPMPEGLVVSYIHHNHKVGAMIEIGCQTDFAAHVLVDFAKSICMQIAATNPEFISESDVPEERVIKEKDNIKATMRANNKRPEVIDRYIKSRMRKFYLERCLLSQKSVSDSRYSVRDLLNLKIREVGENISIIRFSRFQVGK